jgi:tripartite-type tricarboxylate transporter receptor subunit TctC
VLRGHQAGTVKPLAVASNQRMPNFPDLPTAAETIPGFAASGWQALLAPVGTPESIVHKISDDLRKALGDPETRKKLATLGRDAPPMSPAEVTAFIQGEQRMWAPIIQQIARAQRPDVFANRRACSNLVLPRWNGISHAKTTAKRVPPFHPLAHGTRNAA